MKNKVLLLCFIASWPFSFGTHTALARGTDIKIDGEQEKCTYKLDNIKPYIVAEKTNQIDTEAIEKIFTLNWTKGRRKLHGELTLHCTIKNITNDADSGPPLAPMELIIEEDAGGRYARHVAWQKDLKAVNWPAKVAYINYINGDGQRDPVNDFFICSKTNKIPCIYFSIKENKINASEIKSALSIIERISISDP